MGELRLAALVTDVATQLMPVTSATLLPTLEKVLRELVEYFGVDVSFVRRHDQAHRTTTLVAEWPPRPNIPDPDPLGVISFETADPTFARTEHLDDVGFTRPEVATAEYQERVREGSGVPAISGATVPLRSGEVTTGVLGFIKYGDRDWSSGEVNALKAIAALLAHLQGRLVAEETLHRLAEHDELTGLANRRALMRHLRARITAGVPDPAALLFIDVDRLKAINDFLGHQAGDDFIAAIAARLRDGDCCQDDFVARLGGDEFVIAVAQACDTDAATEVAYRVRDLLNAPVSLGAQELTRSVSIGISVARPGQSGVSEWLANADQALLAAKAQGGNVIVPFTQEMREQNAVRNDIELHLRTAIADGSLVLYYQPEVDLQSGRVIGVEALVRWHHPSLGLLQPDSFIDVAEATNLAGELGQWVLQEACRQYASWHSKIPGLDLCLRVNISPVQLIAVDFVDGVSTLLAEHDIDAGYLTLEITEHAVVSDLGPVLRTLRRLRKIGIQVAIDDFGTGYSSLAQLKTLPVNTLKIDQQFVRELGTNPDDLAIVRSIIGLAGAFGLDIVAEGVETRLAAHTLIELGCVRAQGYLFSQPLPAADLHKVLLHGYIATGG